MGATEPGPVKPCLFLRENGHGFGIDMGATEPGPVEPCLFLRENGHGFQITMSILP